MDEVDLNQQRYFQMEQITYEQSLLRIHAMIENCAKTYGKHSDEVFVDLAELT